MRVPSIYGILNKTGESLLRSDMRYQRIMMKLSGGAVAGENTWGFDPQAINHIADEILHTRQAGIQIGVVVGVEISSKASWPKPGGSKGPKRTISEMMATVINSLLLRGVLQARGDVEVRVMTAIPIDTVAEPFIRLRAIRHLEHGAIIILAAGTGNPYVTTDYPAVQRALELRAEALLAAKHGTDGIYSADPHHDPTARRYRAIHYNRVIADNLQVMDQSAVLLARDHNLPIHVFDFFAPGALLKLCQGKKSARALAGKITANKRRSLRSHLHLRQQPLYIGGIQPPGSNLQRVGRPGRDCQAQGFFERLVRQQAAGEPGQESVARAYCADRFNLRGLRQPGSLAICRDSPCPAQGNHYLPTRPPGQLVDHVAHIVQGLQRPAHQLAQLSPVALQQVRAAFL